MSALESLIASSGEAGLLDSLSFDLPPSTTAIVDKKIRCRAYPTSASTLTPTGTRTLRIRLGGDNFVDPQSVRLVYTINELAGVTGQPLIPNAGPWAAWSQVRLLANSQEIDNIGSSYGRLHQQFLWNQLSMAEQYNEAAYGWGGSWGSNAGYTVPLQGQIAPHGSLTVSHKLCLSLFQQQKMIPLRYCPLELEVTLNSNLADWLDIADGSQSLSISNVQLWYNNISVDEAIQESFYRALLANRVLNIPCIQMWQVVQSIPSGATSFSFSAVRAFSRLSHVWLSFRATNEGSGARAWNFAYPVVIPDTAITETPTFASDFAPLVRLSLGPKNYPDPAPISTFGEYFMQLQEALPYPPNIDRNRFLQNAFTVAFDLRRADGDPTSSVSTRSGDLINVQIQNMTANIVQEVWMTMFSFSCCAIRESGVTILN